MKPTFLITLEEIQLSSSSEEEAQIFLKETAENIEDSLSLDGFNVDSVKPWTNPSPPLSPTLEDFSSLS